MYFSFTEKARPGVIGAERVSMVSVPVTLWKAVLALRFGVILLYILRTSEIRL